MRPSQTSSGREKKVDWQITHFWKSGQTEYLYILRTRVKVFTFVHARETCFVRSVMRFCKTNQSFLRCIRSRYEKKYKFHGNTLLGKIYYVRATTISLRANLNMQTGRVNLRSIDESLRLDGRACSRLQVMIYPVDVLCGLKKTTNSYKPYIHEVARVVILRA